MDKIDTSIFTNYRNPYPIDVQERALKQQTLNSLVAQNQRADQQMQWQQEDRQAAQNALQLKNARDEKIKNVYRNSTDQTGKINYDQLLPQLYQIDPELGQKTELSYQDILGKKATYNEHIATAQKANEDLNKMKLDARMKEYGLAYNVLSSVKQFDNDGWQNAKQMLLHSGLQLQMPDDTPINIPDKYDANFVQALNGMSTTIGDAFTRQQDIDKANLEREKFEEEKRKNRANENILLKNVAVKEKEQEGKPAYSERTYALKPNQVEALTGFDDAESQLKTIENLYKKAYTGFVKGRVGSIKDFFGALPEEEAAFRTAKQAFDNALIKLQAGSAVSGQEAIRMKRELGDFTKGEEQFKATINRAKSKIKNSKNIYIQGLKKSKFDVGEWGEETTPVDLTGGTKPPENNKKSNLSDIEAINQLFPASK